MKNVLFILAVVITALVLPTTVSAQSHAQNDTIVGAIIGAVAGGVIGHQSGERDKGIAVGAAVGAVLGYGHGNERDKRVYYPHPQVVVVRQQPRRVIYPDQGWTCRPPAPIYRPAVYQTRPPVVYYPRHRPMIRYHPPRHPPQVVVVIQTGRRR